jgi:hypothetical protein
MPHHHRDHYYLSDAMGGNVGLYVDDDGHRGCRRVLVCGLGHALRQNHPAG